MKHELLNRLGSGGNGVVLRAVATGTNRLVAVKFVHRRDSDPQAAQRVFGEAHSQARLDHPNIVKIYDAGDYPDGRYFIEMQLIDGCSLATKAAQSLRNPEAAAQLIATVALAIDFAHDQNVVHCDLKPANIIIERHTGEPFVTDFGIAQLLDFDAHAYPIGTLPYMAPEQCQYQPDNELTIDRWTDVYALGSILYELVTGKPPYPDAHTLEERQARFAAGVMPPAPSLAPAPHYAIGRALDRELDRILEGALSIHRHARYPNAGALAADLDRWVHGQPIHGPHRDRPTWWQSGTRFVRRNASLLALAFVPAFLGLVLSVYFSLSLIDARKHTLLSTNHIIAELVGRNLELSIREAKQGVIAMSRDPFTVDILRNQRPAGTQAQDVEPESWAKLATALKKSGADQFYLIDYHGCIVRYWPAPAPAHVYERWYGFRHYYECAMQAAETGRDACLARVYKSEYDYYANTLRTAVSAPVYTSDETHALLGVLVASWPADRTLGSITLGHIPDSDATTSILFLRDLERQQATAQLGALETPRCAAAGTQVSAGVSTPERFFKRLQRGAREIAFPRDGIGGESLLSHATTRALLASPVALDHYVDPRDDVDQLAAFSRLGVLELRAALDNQKVEATPIVVATTRHEELHSYMWKLGSIVFVLCVVCLGLMAFFVYSLRLQDAAKIRKSSTTKPGPR